MISVTLRLAKHTKVQSLEMHKKVPKDKPRREQPSLARQPQGQCPGMDSQIRQAALGRGCRLCSSARMSARKGFLPRSQAHPFHRAWLSYFISVSVGSSLRDRGAPSFFGIMPRRIRCQHQLPVAREFVIKCTNKTAGWGVPTLG